MPTSSWNLTRGKEAADEALFSGCLLYTSEQAELTEKIEQYEREGRAEHDQLDKIQDFIDEVSKYAGITEQMCIRDRQRRWQPTRSHSADAPGNGRTWQLAPESPKGIRP